MFFIAHTFSSTHEPRWVGYIYIIYVKTYVTIALPQSKPQLCPSRTSLSVYPQCPFNSHIPDWFFQSPFLTLSWEPQAKDQWSGLLRGRGPQQVPGCEARAGAPDARRRGPQPRRPNLDQRPWQSPSLSPLANWLFYKKGRGILNYHSPCTVICLYYKIFQYKWCGTFIMPVLQILKYLHKM